MIEAHALTCRRGGRELFADLSLSVQAGQLWLVQGPNGSGKTSLLRVLAGLSPATSGELLWPDGRQPVLWFGHRPGVSADLTVRENLEFLAQLDGEPGDLRTALAAVGLTGLASTRARLLSAGQSRRIALARLALSTRRLWLLDEPMTSLDEASVQWLEEQTRVQLARGGAVVMATHRGVSSSLDARVLRLGT